jgi:hypothetical protein
MTDLRQHLEQRLATLERERELGEQRLRELERESLRLQQTLLRISGAAQVLREVLDEAPGPPEPGAQAPGPVQAPGVPAGDGTRTGATI